MKDHLWGYIRRNKSLLLVFVFITVGISFVAPLKSFIIQWLIDAPSKGKAIYYLGIGAFITFLSFILELLSRNLWVKIASGCIEEIRNKVMSKYLKMSMKEYFDTGNSEGISVLTHSIRILQTDYYEAIYHIVLYGGMLLFAVAMLLYINPSMLLYVILASIFPLLIPRILDKKVLISRKKQLEYLKDYTASVGDTLKGYEIVRQFDASERFAHKHRSINAKLTGVDISFRQKMNLSLTTTSLVSNLLFFLLLLLGILLFYDGQLSIGYMVAATNLTNYVIAPIKMISQMVSKVKSTQSIRKELIELIDAGETSKDGVSIGEITSIRWENVHFAYSSTTPHILSDLNMEWRKSDKIAIYGNSGSGKTTIFRLLLKYFNQYEGRILLNETELRSISYESLYRQVGVIAQSPHIFNDTIRNNICLYDEFSDDEIDSALQLSGMTEFIRGLPNGINTQILENGKNISGGQAQRIAIARAIIRNKSVILVDEGTTGLDSAMSEEIMNTILGLDAIVVVISHDRDAAYNSIFDKKYELREKEICTI